MGIYKIIIKNKIVLNMQKKKVCLKGSVGQRDKVKRRDSVMAEV